MVRIASSYARTVARLVIVILLGPTTATTKTMRRIAFDAAQPHFSTDVLGIVGDADDACSPWTRAQTAFDPVPALAEWYSTHR